MSEHKERRKNHKIHELPWNERWKPYAAFIYLVICFFDFVVIPTYIGVYRPSIEDLIPIMKELDAGVQAMLVSQYRWEPLTTSNGGLFHIAFGAILGVSAFNRREIIRDRDNE